MRAQAARWALRNLVYRLSAVLLRGAVCGRTLSMKKLRRFLEEKMGLPLNALDAEELKAAVEKRVDRAREPAARCAPPAAVMGDPPRRAVPCRPRRAASPPMGGAR